jgi:hypothetical protein
MLKINVTTASDLTSEEKEKIDIAANYLQGVVNTEEFKEFVLNYYWFKEIQTGMLWWKKYRHEKMTNFHDTDLLNFEVYNLIMSGAETLDPSHDKTANIYLHIDRRFRRRVIGYTYPTTKWQWIYDWAFKSFTIPEIAGNIFHEWLHKIGFEHEYKYSFSRNHSVPYALGTYVEQTIKSSSFCI